MSESNAEIRSHSTEVWTKVGRRRIRQRRMQRSFWGKLLESNGMRREYYKKFWEEFINPNVIQSASTFVITPTRLVNSQIHHLFAHFRSYFLNYTHSKLLKFLRYNLKVSHRSHICKQYLIIWNSQYDLSYTKFHMLGASGSVITAIKPKGTWATCFERTRCCFVL